MKKKFLALVLTLAMAFSLLPATALAVETDDGTDGGTPTVTVPDGKAKLNGTEYNSVFEAVQAATETEMNTIYLGKGTYTLYDTVSGNAPTNNYTSGKRFTFIGAGRNETTWMIGAPVPNPEKLGSEYNADYSFGGCTKVVFQDMTLSSYYEKENDTKDSNYLGFAHTIDTEVVDCTINGLTFYWGYTSAMFKNTTFNCPDGDYAIWTYSSTEMTFDNCTFNSSGKVINVYNENSAADYTINFNNCTVNNTGTPAKQVLNINDSLVKGFTINITGDTVLKGFDTTTIVDSKTCSRLFGFGGKAETNNKGKTIVKFGNTVVWQGGKMVNEEAYHNEGVTVGGVSYNNGVDGANGSLYAEGYKDNAVTTKTTTQGKRTVTTKTCNYCGWSEKSSTYAWDVSRSKKATKLDNNYESKVTLSLPSAEEPLASDIVFVIDKSQCGKEATTAAQQLVDSLLKRQKVTDAKIKVGIVIFGGTAIVSRELSEVTNAEDLKSAVSSAARTGLHGSNVQSGLIEADQMLSTDTEVANSRKYVVLIADGHTYQFSKEKEYETYTENGTSFNALKTYGIYNENDLYAYSHGISYTIHSMHDQYYTGDYNDNGTYKDGWSGSYLTDAQYKTGTLGNSNEVGNVYEMPYGTWSQYLEHITSVVTADNGKYDVLLTHTNGDYDNQCIGNNANTSREERAALADKALGENMYIKCGLDANGKDNQLMHASGTDRAVYEAYTKYASMAKKYNCYPIYVSKDNTDPNNYDAAKTTQDYGYQLIHAMGEISHNTGTSVAVANEAITPDKIRVNVTSAFSSIQNDILYAVSAGSIVTDTIGEKFTFGGVDSFTLKVGTEKIEGVKDTSDENTVNFGDLKPDNSYPYTVTYTPDTKTFVWTINENVSNFAPVQLTYTVKLTTPETDPGTYGTEDLKGEKDVPADKALFTNESAVLNAINSAGAPVKEQAFPKPSVSYTVKNSHRPGGSGGGTITIPDDVPTGLNGKDHYAYVVGYPDGMVYPQKNITRAEVATIFFRLLKDETREANMTKSNGYNDMKDGAWYTCAVSTLSKMGIIKGYEDGSFKPDASISRAEFAAIAARFDPDGDKTPATFSDVSSHWAKDEISIAANHGWIKGYEDGSFKPDQKITRAETMTLVNRVLKRLPETKDDLHKDMKTWPDNQNESAWFYLAVQEATNSHYQKLKKDGTHETWESMRETRDWAALEK